MKFDSIIKYTRNIKIFVSLGNKNKIFLFKNCQSVYRTLV